MARAGRRAVDLGGPSVYQGGQSLKLITKAAVFKRVSLLIGGQTCSGTSPWRRPCPWRTQTTHREHWGRAHPMTTLHICTVSIFYLNTVLFDWYKNLCFDSYAQTISSRGIGWKEQVFFLKYFLLGTTKLLCPLSATVQAISPLAEGGTNAPKLLVDLIILIG